MTWPRAPRTMARHRERRWFVVLPDMTVVAYADTAADAETIIVALERRGIRADVVPPEGLLDGKENQRKGTA